MKTFIISATFFSFLFSSPSNNKISANAEDWEGKWFKRGQTARCADFVGTIVKNSGGTPPKGYAKCNNWLSWGKSVSINNIKQGDIIIYGKRGRYNHIGIYVGNGEIIHRPTKSKKVGRLHYKYRNIIGIRRLK